MREKIKELLKQSLMLPEIDEQIERQETAAWDSLKHLMFISNLEEEFGVSVEPEQFTELNNLESIEQIVTQLLSKK
jgi:acyl carrier protein